MNVEPTIDDDPDDEVVVASPEGLVTEIRPFVSRYCRGSLGNLVDTVDRITEEVCQAIVDAVPGSPVTGRSLRAFAYRIAAQRVDEALRSIGRNRTHLPADRLGELLRELPAFQREALLLRVAVGLSVEQTAQAVGSTPDAIRLAQHRALVRLRGAVVGTDERDDLTH